ncbi:hypothetical protein DPMN_021455 [Dreissena polymorpha]|uniref:Uncharacterized protein n=1 Tax=Dreissena polymorpha TaxID=45954 RepID=A0A9D4SB13_DREPO|nr:hypothetical protein DPMN_021455 [Dreissena polymorpha]
MGSERLGRLLSQKEATDVGEGRLSLATSRGCQYGTGHPDKEPDYPEHFLAYSAWI